MTVQALVDLADAAQKLGLEEGEQGLDVSVHHCLPKVTMHLLATGQVKQDKKEKNKGVSRRGGQEEEDDEDEEEDEDEEDEDEGEGEEEEEESAQSLLFEASLEMLSVTGDHAVKGVREAIKKVWHALCAHR